MVRVDGMKGWGRWYENGCRLELENPNWRQCLPEYVEVTEQGAVELSLDSAMQVALEQFTLSERTLLANLRAREASSGGPA